MKRHLLTISDLFRKIEFKIAAAAVIILSLIPLNFGRYDRVAGAIADAGHFWFYFVVYLYLRKVLKRPNRLLLALIVVSGLIELIQPYVQRDGNLQDFAVSSFGAVCGLLFSLKRPLVLRVIFTIICALPFFFPIYWRIDALRYQEKEFPELSGFKDPRWRSLWEAATPDHAPSATIYLDSKGDLLVRAMAGMAWPGLVYLNQYLSWAGYNNLEIELESYGDSEITVRVDDDQDCREYESRFNKGFLVKDGLNKIQIPFDELRMTRSGRMMNIDKIKKVALYTNLARAKAEKIFAIKAMRLIK